MRSHDRAFLSSLAGTVQGPQHRQDCVRLGVNRSRNMFAQLLHRQPAARDTTICYYFIQDGQIEIIKIHRRQLSISFEFAFRRRCLSDVADPVAFCSQAAHDDVVDGDEPERLA